MNRKGMLGLLVGMIVVMSSLFIWQSTKQSAVRGAKEETSKNVIVLIGDGMGLPQVTLTRLYAQQYLDRDRLHIDDYLVGTNSTHADRNVESGESGIVTDSAASGTAFATGHKTYNGAIAVTNEEVARPVASVLEAAKEAGKSTGLITTARVTHATPAVYASHVRSRDNENAIASQYADFGLDVILGGGERHFVASDEQAVFGTTKREDGIHLIDAFKENGYEVAHTKEALAQVNGDRLLGLFSDTHIPYNLDRDESVPTLTEQFEAAVRVLEKNDEGFIMMIEGGRIDHAGHANDLHSVVQEMLEFDEVFQAAIDYAERDGHTSVIATADHETGGLTIGSQNIYDAYLDVFEPVTASSEVIGEQLEDATEDEVKQLVKRYTGIDDLSKEELALIMSGQLPDGTVSSYGREGSFNAVIAKRGVFGWTGHGHTGVDVGVYGVGPAAELLRGFHDNTDFAKAAATVLGLDLDKTTETLQARFAYPKFMEADDGTPLFPVQPIAERFGFEVTEDVLRGNGEEMKVASDGKTVTHGETTYDVRINEQEMYVPFDVIDALTKSSLTWDPLSERIVIEDGKANE